MVDKHILHQMSHLRIGQKVLLLSLDAGVPNEEMYIWGLNISCSMPNITLGDKDGLYQIDGYVPEDILILSSNDL